MQAFDWDLIRGAHYGQRSCEPRIQAEHMAAPTNPAYVKALANRAADIADVCACLSIRTNCERGRIDPAHE